MPNDFWHPAVVVIDEAHLLAPFGASSGAGDHLRKESIAAVADVMGRGRKRGLIGLIATQRLARLSKSVVAEATNILIGRNVLDLDAARASEILGIQRRSGMARLRKLAPGEFIAVGPALGDGVAVVAIGPVQTTHRGRTPALDAPPVIAASDAGALISALPTVEPDEPAPRRSKARQRRPDEWTEDEPESSGKAMTGRSREPPSPRSCLDGR